MSDLIDRQVAIDYLMTNMNWYEEDGYESDDDYKRECITELINGVPSAQTSIPKMEQAGDCISRKTVLDKLNRLIEVERLQGTDEMGYGRERVNAYENMIFEIESEYLHPFVNPKEQKTDWIPVSERLPEEDGQYLITVKYVHVDGYDDIYAEHGEWIDGKWDTFCFGHCGQVEAILAWMPLPQPYKAESESDVQ